MSDNGEKCIFISNEALVACQDLGNSHLAVYVGLKRTRQRVLGYDREMKGKWFTATHHMIAQRTACGIKTIQRCILGLVEAGLVDVRRVKVREGNGTIRNEPNMYRLP